jgi:hypothetical protein
LSVGNRPLDIGPLPGKEGMSLVDLLELSQGHHVDRAKALDLLPQFLEPGFQGCQIQLSFRTDEDRFGALVALLALFRRFIRA